jgi:hypothetical protein
LESSYNRKQKRLTAFPVGLYGRCGGCQKSPKGQIYPLLEKKNEDLFFSAAAAEHLINFDFQKFELELLE